MATWEYTQQPAEFRQEIWKLKLSDLSADLVLVRGGGPREVAAIIRGLGLLTQRNLSIPELELIAQTVEAYPKLRMLGDTADHEQEARKELGTEILTIVGRPK